MGKKKLIITVSCLLLGCIYGISAVSSSGDRDISSKLERQPKVDKKIEENELIKQNQVTLIESEPRNIGNKPGNPTELVEPSKPAEPAKPSKPAEPAKPSKPAEPAKPSKPAEPAKPSKPAEPAKPNKPAEPAKPSKPAEPAKPNKPAEPAKFVVNNPESIFVLVNKQRYVPESYTPPLRGFPTGYAVNKNQKARPEVVQAYVKMQDQMEKEIGLTMYVTSSYRTFAYQQGLFDRYVKKDGVAKAERYSARPGTSEHHTGLALDLETVSGNMTQFGNTEQGKWVERNAHKYGFIIRYKKEWEHITGYMAEPWHIRYLGVEEATRVYKANKPYELMYKGK